MAKKLAKKSAKKNLPATLSKGSAIDDLLGGKLIASRKTEKTGRKKQKASQKLPSETGHLADILVAGRKILREIDFKVRFAEEKVKEYCLERFCDEFAATGSRPESVTYAGAHSIFTFIQTRKITLTPEKAQALDHLNVPVQEHTELNGIRVNFEAIRRHKLETRLRDALAGMGVPKGVLLECFQPEVQLKESFFQHLSAIVSHSLEKGEKLPDKLLQVMKVLKPAEQIRNAELPNMDPVAGFKLIHDTAISVAEDLSVLDED